MTTDTYVLVSPWANRVMVVAAYEAGKLLWSEAYIELYNSGWRAPVDKHGLPARRVEQ